MEIQNTIRIENHWKVISCTTKKRSKKKQRGDSVLSYFEYFFFMGHTHIDLINIISFMVVKGDEDNQKKVTIVNGLHFSITSTQTGQGRRHKQI